MRKRVCGFILILGLGLIFSHPVFAQDEFPRFEVGAGYSYVRAHFTTVVTDGTDPSFSLNFNGGSGEVAYNVTNWLGIVGDIGGYTTNSTPSLNGVRFNVNTNVISYMFGPRINFRQFGRVTPFVNGLFGGARLADSFVNTGSENAFAMAAGGGLDIKMSEHIYIRPVQAEYFMTTFKDLNNNRQNNFRYSAGIVLKF
jgi:opacity protein-like surface antigen